MELPVIIKHPVESIKTAPTMALAGIINLMPAGYNLDYYVSHDMTTQRSLGNAALSAGIALVCGLYVNNASKERVELEEQIKECGISDALAHMTLRPNARTNRIVRLAMKNTGNVDRYSQNTEAHMAAQIVIQGEVVSAVTHPARDLKQISGVE